MASVTVCGRVCVFVCVKYGAYFNINTSNLYVGPVYFNKIHVKIDKFSRIDRDFFQIDCDNLIVFASLSWLCYTIFGHTQ